MELLDFSREYDAETLAEALESCVKEGKMKQDMADCILIKDILGFLQSPAGQRMQEAAKTV